MVLCNEDSVAKETKPGISLFFNFCCAGARTPGKGACSESGRESSGAGVEPSSRMNEPYQVLSSELTSRDSCPRLPLPNDCLPCQPHGSALCPSFDS